MHSDGYTQYDGGYDYDCEYEWYANETRVRMPCTTPKPSTPKNKTVATYDFATRDMYTYNKNTITHVCAINNSTVRTAKHTDAREYDSA